MAPLICGLLSIAIIFIVEFIYRGKRALLERGNIATAIILNEKIFASRGRRYSKLTYEFSLQDERRFRGTRSYVPIKEASSPEDIAWRAVYVDTPTVLYDADNPRKNALYPMMWAKLRAERKEAPVKLLPFLALLPLWGTAAFAESGPLCGEALDQKCTNSAKGLLQTVYRLPTSASMMMPSKDGKSRLIYLNAENGGKTEVHLYECSPQSDGSVALVYQGVQDKKP